MKSFEELAKESGVESGKKSNNFFLLLFNSFIPTINLQLKILKLFSFNLIIFITLFYYKVLEISIFEFIIYNSILFLIIYFILIFLRFNNIKNGHQFFLFINNKIDNFKLKLHEKNKKYNQSDNRENNRFFFPPSVSEERIKLLLKHYYNNFETLNLYQFQKFISLKLHMVLNDMAFTETKEKLDILEHTFNIYINTSDYILNNFEQIKKWKI